MKYIFVSILFLLILSCPPQDLNKLNKIIEQHQATLGPVINNAEEYEVQIRYTQINRDKNNSPSFETFDYRVNPTEYFYPASSVKMPVAFLAMEKINQIKPKAHPDLNIHSAMQIDSIRAPQTAVKVDTTAKNGLPSVAHYVKKIFAVSDNDAFNRLFEFVGRKSINESLKTKGINHSKIMHRLSVSGYDNRYTNPVSFYKLDELYYTQGEQFDETIYPNIYNNTSKGVAHFSNGKKVNQPFDFSQKNGCSIPDLEAVMKAVIFPEVTPPEQQFDLTESDYKYLYQVMSALPREHEHPYYDREEYYDGYVKFFLYGDTKNPIPDNIRIFNKVGYAYGYLTDCAYIVDFENKVEFLLTATIHVNKNKTYNDNEYEYDEIGIPFLANLGRAVYEYELNRERAVVPDLTKYKH